MIKNILFMILLSLFLIGCTEQIADTRTKQDAKDTTDNSDTIQTDNTNDIVDDVNSPSSDQIPPFPDEISPDFISLAELAKHNSESDCWVAYNGNVYDVTAFLGKHKGGSAAIMKTCGTVEAFSNAFTGKHGTSKESVLESEGIIKGELQ